MSLVEKIFRIFHANLLNNLPINIGVLLMVKNNYCSFCNVQLGKDVVALNKKLLGRNVKKQLCIRCLAEYLSCAEEDLRVKIQEFKDQGCTLFI